MDLQLFILHETNSIVVVVTTNVQVSLDLPICPGLGTTGSVRLPLVNEMQTPFFQVSCLLDDTLYE